jgi:hypothetical protein
MANGGTVEEEAAVELQIRRHFRRRHAHERRTLSRNGKFLSVLLSDHPHCSCYLSCRKAMVTVFAIVASFYGETYGSANVEVPISI